MKNSSATSQWTTVQSKGCFPSIIGWQSLLSAQIPIAILHMSQHFKMICLFLSILIHATTLNFRAERNVVLPFWNHDTWMGIQYTFQSSPSLPSASKTGWVVCCCILGLKRRWITPGYHWQTAWHLPRKWGTFLMEKSYETSKALMASILELVAKVDMPFLCVWITSIHVISLVIWFPFLSFQSIGFVERINGSSIPTLPSKSNWPFPVRPLSYVVTFFNPDLFYRQL